jgi:predicted RNA-binding protein with PIN domain
MHYLIDGYNYLHRAKLFDARRLEHGRSVLALRLAPLLARGDRGTIFWDAHGPVRPGPSREVIHGFEMVYCHGVEGADGAIRAYARAVLDPDEVCVVTDDRAVREPARQLGAGTLWVRDVEAKVAPREPADGRRKRGRARPAAPAAGPDRATDDAEEDAKPPAPGGSEVGEWLDYFDASEDERE